MDRPEQEQILINVFDMKDIIDPASKKNSPKTDRGEGSRCRRRRRDGPQESDGRGAQGNRVEMYGHFASNSWVDEDLENGGPGLQISE